MSKTNRAFRYAGSKQHLVYYVNRCLPEDPENYMYIEPFLGSGTIFYNLSKQFKWNYLTDIDKHIIRLHETFIKFRYDEYKYIVDWVKDTFGDIKTDKEAYYKLRNHYNNDTNGFKDLKLLCLANSCINSMLRFGPNGMNQSFGGRHYIISEEVWNSMKSRLATATLKMLSYVNSFEMIKEYSNLQFFLVLDPPYVDREMTYNNSFDRTKFIEKLKELANYNVKIIYTDIENSESDQLLDYDFKKIPSKMLRNSSPYSSKQFTKKEVVYQYNINNITVN